MLSKSLGMFWTVLADIQSSAHEQYGAAEHNSYSLDRYRHDPQAPVTDRLARYMVILESDKSAEKKETR